MVQQSTQQMEQSTVCVIWKISGEVMNWHGAQDLLQVFMDARHHLNIINP